MASSPQGLIILSGSEPMILSMIQRTGDVDGIYLREADVERMGCILVGLAERFPRTMGTESQMSPALLAMLQVQDGKATPERRVVGGRIDFRTAGTNPSLLEFAVAPRLLRTGDKGSHLSPSQNESELKKLASASARSKYLLLVDLAKDDHDYQPSYKLFCEKHALMISGSIKVVVAFRSKEIRVFKLQ